MPRRNPPSGLTPTEIRTKVWRHNSFFGHARMMQSQAEHIIHSPTTSLEAKATARRIFNEAKLLIQQLKERVDK